MLNARIAKELFPINYKQLMTMLNGGQIYGFKKRDPEGKVVYPVLTYHKADVIKELERRLEQTNKRTNNDLVRFFLNGLQQNQPEE
jgi:hypothetical protein